MRSIVQLINILLVEDDPGDQELIKYSMDQQRINNKMYIVNHGQEALDFLNQTGKFIGVPRPDIILLDLNMPILDGKEFLKIVKENPKFKSIPIIVLTTSEYEKDIKESYELHANSFINKPIDFSEFTRVLSVFRKFWFGINILPLNNS